MGVGRSGGGRVISGAFLSRGWEVVVGEKKVEVVGEGVVGGMVVEVGVIGVVGVLG